MVSTWQYLYIQSLKSMFRPVYEHGFVAGCKQGFGVGSEQDPNYRFDPATEWCKKQATVQ